ncbi:MAG: hypothetical protein QOI15_158 [Pseudonocardiales bacterium]|nr:hypothetical protein [Pseudonocardiales bacterium]
MNRPTMRRTHWTDLIPPLLVAAITTYAFLRFSYHGYLQLKYLVPAPLGALAVAEFVAARRVRNAVRHDPDAKPMAALVIARCVALGKASSVVGAAVVGFSTALLVRLLPDVGTVTVARHDASVAGLLLGAALLLMVGGLVLERAGVDPNSDGNGR